ncbi:prolyl oligopeptidase family serine peptidase [Streptomyces sp. NPDC093586]|uniref:prolyl oligopeptidase family serine peptidase n=1 Tax=Streptomyces sp. NPDC093586 TaxID=3366042 RepID=UPI0038279D90
MLGAPAADAPERAREASPVVRVTPDAPPFLILHGEADTVIPVTQGQALASALRAAGTEAGSRAVAGAGRLWIGAAEADGEHCFTSSLDFVRGRTE